MSTTTSNLWSWVGWRDVNWQDRQDYPNKMEERYKAFMHVLRFYKFKRSKGNEVNECFVLFHCAVYRYGGTDRLNGEGGRRRVRVRYLYVSSLHYEPYDPRRKRIVRSGNIIKLYPDNPNVNVSSKSNFRIDFLDASKLSNVLVLVTSKVEWIHKRSL